MHNSISYIRKQRRKPILREPPVIAVRLEIDTVIYINTISSCKRSNKQRLEFNQFSSVSQSCPTLCNPMNRSTPGLHVHHQLPEST